MTKTPKTQLAFGDLVAAAYDCAEMVASDQSTVNGLASRTLARWLVQTDRLDLAQALAPQGSHKPPARARRLPRTAKAA
jgi:hypothetical protein